MPNILVFLTDQQRFDSLGCYGFRGIPTPNLDRLAAEGVLFENCYVNNPICTPSRASIFTGKPLPGHGVYRLNDILPKDQVLFTKRLQERGYETALIGKLHVSGAVYERDHRNPGDGFDLYEWCHEPAIFLEGQYNAYARWLRENYPDFYLRLEKEGRELKNVPQEMHFTHWAAERTIDFIKKRKKDGPFFCLMSLFDPHNPYTDYPLEMLDLIDERAIPDPVLVEAHNKPVPVLREHENGYMGSFHRYTKEDLRRMRIGYYASVAFIDQEVGRVLAVLEEEKIEDDTMVIFVSDHGDMLGDHELLAKGAFFYDPSTKVPLIIRYPGKVPAGFRVKELVQPHDLAATVLARAGFTREELNTVMPDSIDLLSILDGNTNNLRDHAVCIYRGTGISDQKVYFNPPFHATMFRNERYKLNVYHNVPMGNGELQGELYDLVNDPLEMRNLWGDAGYMEIKWHLMGRLMDWMVNCDLKYNGSRGGGASPVNRSLLCR